MKITEIYKSMLSYLGLEADDNGSINTIMNGKKEPVIINGARLVLPTIEQLKSFNHKEVVIFHPLLENILQSESPVIDKVKNIINIKLNYTIGIIIQSLLNIVASPELHSKLNPEQAELLIKIKEADEKTVLNFINIMIHGIKTKANSLFTNIYLRRGGTYKDKKYSRVGIVMFPFYKDVIDNKIEKIRVKDKETYKDIMEFIFPDINDSEAYNYGSSSNVAPYIDAIMMTSVNLASRLNDILYMYSEYIDEGDKLIFSSEWLEYFNNLEQLMPEIRKIPMQYGNDGNMVVEIAQEQQPVAPPQAWQQPYQQPQPYPQNTPPVLKKTSKGLDFKSVMQANPALAYNSNVMNPLLARQMPPQMPMQNNPSWAMPQMPNQFQQPMIPGMNYPPQQGMVPPMGYPMQQPMMPGMGYPNQQPMMPNMGYPPNYYQR